MLLFYKTEGPRVRASPASLLCGPWARHIYPSLVLVQAMKTHPCLTEKSLTERLLMGRKESNQTTKQNKRPRIFFAVCIQCNPAKTFILGCGINICFISQANHIIGTPKNRLVDTVPLSS